MPIDISVRFAFALEQASDVLLQFTAAQIPEQAILSSEVTMPASAHQGWIPAQDNIGERVWLRLQGRCEVSYRARVELNRTLADVATLGRLPLHQLPAEAVQYLFDSRYCQADRFHSFVEAEFGSLDGGPRVIAMRDWVADNLVYTPGSSTSTTTALDSFVERRGVCRDYAHVLITFLRASGMPARFCSVFAPGVDPPDFHAVAEVFLADPTVSGGGAWHLLDATGMAQAGEIVKIGVGRDAADVSFMTVFGEAMFEDKEISVVWSA